MAGSQEDIMELLRLTIHKQEDLRYIAETLRSLEYTVPTLLKLENSELEAIVDHQLSAASPGAKMGFKAAIRTRKENLTHVSPSIAEQLAEITKQFAESLEANGKVTKQLAEYLEANGKVTKQLAEYLEANGKVTKQLAESLEANGKVTKQLTKLLDGREAKTKSLTLSISNVNSRKWDILERDLGVQVI